MTNEKEPANQDRLTVSLGDRSYPIVIGEQLVSGGCAELDELITARQVAIVSNQTVFDLYGSDLHRYCASKSAALIDVVLPDGEQYKQWPQVNQVIDQLLEARFDRNALIIALGGGVVGDIAGFAAAVYQRGIEFVQVPTTLLAQVDSSVGGKTGINHPAGKNMIGAFHQPRLVLADMSILSTLPAREISAGLAEMIKHGAIADPDYLTSLENSMSDLKRCDSAALAAAVLRSCEIKAQVVAADEREAGLRAILNFGHTFGHAIEAGLGYGKWLHGEAVAAGMVMASDLSVRTGNIDNSVLRRLTDTIASADLPITGPRWTSKQYLDLMAVDKKASQGVPKFVLLTALGRATTTTVEPALVHQTLDALATADL